MCTREGHKEQPHVHTMSNAHRSVVTAVQQSASPVNKLGQHKEIIHTNLDYKAWTFILPFTVFILVKTGKDENTE